MSTRTPGPWELEAEAVGSRPEVSLLKISMAQWLGVRVVKTANDREHEVRIARAAAQRDAEVARHEEWKRLGLCACSRGCR